MTIHITLLVVVNRYGNYLIMYGIYIMKVVLKDAYLLVSLYPYIYYITIV